MITIPDRNFFYLKVKILKNLILML